MPQSMVTANDEQTFEPLEYVVDIKGNRYSENLKLEEENVEELELGAAKTDA